MDHKVRAWEGGSVAGHPWLYVGSLSAAEDVTALSCLGVTRVLTVADRIKVHGLPAEIEHTTLEIPDHPCANLLDILPEALNVITAAAEEAASSSSSSSTSSRPALLVHCASGVSRSVACVVAWLIVNQDLTVSDAVDAVRAGRSLASPNVGFRQQLELLFLAGGDIQAAQKRFAEHNLGDAQADPFARAVQRREVANAAHANVDALEARAQASKSLRNPSAQVPRTVLQREMEHLRTTLDADRAGDGLPEDNVARIILKSASDKLNRLIDEVSF